MKSYSMHKQDDVWYRKEVPGRHIVRLRKNHTQETKKDMDGQDITQWVCDEVEMSIPYKNDIKKYVTEHFDELFNEASNR